MRPSLSRLLLPFAFLLPGLGAQSEIDAQHYKLEIELFFTTKTISGTCTGTFKSLVNGLKTFDLDLHSGLAVSSVKMGTKSLSFTRPTNRIRITLDRTYNLNELFTLAVSYGGSPPRGAGWGGFTFTSHSGSPMAWTLSEPWDARTWWPGKDALGDKSTFEIWITHPNTMTAASNGTLQGIDTLSGNRLRTRWKEIYPMIPYLASLAVTNYKKRVDTYSHLGATMPVEFYVFPEYFTSWQSGMNLIVPMLKAYSDAFGQYPFIKEKYGIAQFTWGGAMEHQTISSQSSIAGWLSAHELSHQWWGDMVTCATWKDIWLNEGFATFAEALWEERKPGGSMAAYHNWMRRRRPYNYNGIVYVYNPTSIWAIFNSNNVYRKGGWVLHQLRHVLGDKVFFQSLLDYRKAYEGKSATTDQFRLSCEKTAGRDLKWFFDQWVMKGGAPYYRYAWKNKKVGSRDYLYLEIDQTQSTQSVFLMPIDVRVRTTAGTETHVVWDDERQDQFVLPLKAPASSVSLDPENWILRGTNYGRTFTTPFFAASAESLDTAQGGSSGLHIDQGPTYQNRLYLALLGASGSKPGTKVLSLLVPLNFDSLTNLTLAALNTPVFASFLGKLDAAGGAVPTFNLPPGIGLPLKGTRLTACFLLIDRFDFASRPVTIELR